MHPNRDQREICDVAVLGAGISGLTAATRLAEDGFRPQVFEAHDTVGGLAMTVREKDYSFDLGGHRWYSNNKEVDRFFREALSGELLTVRRYSRIAYGRDRFFQYPIRFGDVVRLLGFGYGLLAAFSLVRERLRKRAPIVNAEQAYIRSFGKAIYRKFFKDYTERLWGIPCDRLDGRWVNQRSDNLTIWKILKGFFTKVTDFEAIDEFVYPKEGYGRFCERMAEKVESLGGGVHTGRRLIKWRRADWGFELQFADAAGALSTVNCRNLVNTIPLDTMVDTSAHSLPGEIQSHRHAIRFRDFIVVTLHLNQEKYTFDTWLYTQTPGLDFVRIHEPKNWSASMVKKPGTTAVVLELPCWRNEGLWNMEDGELTRRVFGQLHEGVTHTQGDLVGSSVVRVKNVYPVYEVGYEAHREALLGWLRQFPGLEVCGRNGLFVYDSSDQPVASGLATARKVADRLRGSEPEALPRPSRDASRTS
jgi:protoporphyrinogen oxidase